MHDSVSHYRTHFSGLDTFRGIFPRFKVKFNHGTLLHVETFDKRNKHIFTSTVIKQLLALEIEVLLDETSTDSSGQDYILFLICLLGAQKKSLIIYWVFCVILPVAQWPRSGLNL